MKGVYCVWLIVLLAIPAANALTTGLPTTCTDSDGGFEILIKGVITSTEGDSSFKLEDRCVTGTNLFEGYCEENAQRFQVVPCEGGCTNGACNKGTSANARPSNTPIEESICTETDDGIDILAQGFTEGIANGRIFRSTDKCVTDNNLWETYCDGNTPHSVVRACPYGCSDGKCRDAPPERPLGSESVLIVTFTQDPQFIENSGALGFMRQVVLFEPKIKSETIPELNALNKKYNIVKAEPTDIREGSYTYALSLQSTRPLAAEEFSRIDAVESASARKKWTCTVTATGVVGTDDSGAKYTYTNKCDGARLERWTCLDTSGGVSPFPDSVACTPTGSSCKIVSGIGTCVLPESGSGAPGGGETCSHTIDANNDGTPDNYTGAVCKGGFGGTYYESYCNSCLQGKWDSKDCVRVDASKDYCRVVYGTSREGCSPGTEGQTCFTDYTFTPGYVCRGGRCVLHTTTTPANCGRPGQECCLSHPLCDSATYPTLKCGQRSTLAAICLFPVGTGTCGNLGQACCGSECNDGVSLKCSSGVCVDATPQPTPPTPQPTPPVPQQPTNPQPTPQPPTCTYGPCTYVGQLQPSDDTSGYYSCDGLCYQWASCPAGKTFSKTSYTCVSPIIPPQNPAPSPQPPTCSYGSCSVPGSTVASSDTSGYYSCDGTCYQWANCPAGTTFKGSGCS